MENTSSQGAAQASVAVWVAVLSFGAIIIAALLLFIIPGPKASEPQVEVATTTEAVAETEESTKPAQPATSAPSNYPAAGSRFMQNGVYVTAIHFNGTSFNPASVTVTHGEEVRFINTSNLTMDVGPQMPNASSPGYSALNQPMAKGKGGIYQVGLTEVGIWAYANQTGSPQPKGTIIVK